MGARLLWGQIGCLLVLDQSAIVVVHALINFAGNDMRGHRVRIDLVDFAQGVF